MRSHRRRSWWSSGTVRLSRSGMSESILVLERVSLMTDSLIFNQMLVVNCLFPMTEYNNVRTVFRSQLCRRARALRGCGARTRLPVAILCQPGKQGGRGRNTVDGHRLLRPRRRACLAGVDLGHARRRRLLRFGLPGRTVARCRTAGQGRCGGCGYLAGACREPLRILVGTSYQRRQHRPESQLLRFRQALARQPALSQPAPLADSRKLAARARKRRRHTRVQAQRGRAGLPRRHDDGPAQPSGWLVLRGTGTELEQPYPAPHYRAVWARSATYSLDRLSHRPWALWAR